MRPSCFRIGTSEDLRVGQSVYAIGNPFGLQHTLTVGCVSGLGRTIPSMTGDRIYGVIQVRADPNSLPTMQPHAPFAEAVRWSWINGLIPIWSVRRPMLLSVPETLGAHCWTRLDGWWASTQQPLLGGARYVGLRALSLHGTLRAATAHTTGLPLTCMGPCLQGRSSGVNFAVAVDKVMEAVPGIIVKKSQA